MSKYFEGITPESIYTALERSSELKRDGLSIVEETKSAGEPQSHFIAYKGQFHPLKAVIKNAMIRCDIDPSVTGRNEFTSHDGRNWLRKIGLPGIVPVELPAHTEPQIRDAERTREYYQRLSRPNQNFFRNAVINSFKGTCGITGCKTLAALEAAHIVPIAEQGSDRKENGILLRADLHRLFDFNLCAINPKDLSVSFHPDVLVDFSELSGKIIHLPKNGPSASSFDNRWDKFKKYV